MHLKERDTRRENCFFRYYRDAYNDKKMTGEESDRGLEYKSVDEDQFLWWVKDTALPVSIQ